MFPSSGPLPISASIDVSFLQLLIFLCILISQKFISSIFASFAVLIHCFVIIMATANIKLFISYISYCFPSSLLMFPFQAFVEAPLYTTFEGVPLAYL